MDRYANTCQIGAKLDVTARYHAVVCYQDDSEDLAELVADRLKQAGLSVYFDQIGAGYPGCEGKVYDIAYHLYSKQANYRVDLLSIATRDSGEAAKADVVYWMRNGNYLIPIRVSPDVQPTEDMVYLDAVVLAWDKMADALAIELVMPPSGSNEERITRFVELYRQEEGGARRRRRRRRRLDACWKESWSRHGSFAEIRVIEASGLRVIGEEAPRRLRSANPEPARSAKSVRVL
jgi:hypothetical protein